ncbi:MAG: hypothetical protein R3B70_46740 [Polyangiaceae bacterium]
MSSNSGSGMSTLLTEIVRAIECMRPANGRIRVSVAREAKWEKSTSNGDEVLVRWLCWSVEDGEKEIVPPQFAVVSVNVTEERLRHELPARFPSVDIIVDDDIDA